MKRASSGHKYENVQMGESNQQYENIFTPNTLSVPEPSVEEKSSKTERTLSKDEAESSEPNKEVRKMLNFTSQIAFSLPRSS